MAKSLKNGQKLKKWPKVEQWSKIEKMAKSLNNGQKLKKCWSTFVHSFNYHQLLTIFF